MQLRTINKIIKTVNSRFEMHAGSRNEYFYIVYDDGKVFETFSIYDSSVRAWSEDMLISEAREFQRKLDVLGK